jgi:S-sulfo-L-cysteine synthase (O-acetyl-L-serine-dependent)
LKNESVTLKDLNKFNSGVEFTYKEKNKDLSKDNFSILNKIGNTPLIKIKNLPGNVSRHVSIFAKAEWFNPGGSIKDRAALNMILEGEKNGLLNHNRIILDATSGNTGIAYALIAAVKGYKVMLALPANASEERKMILNAYGAEIILTNPLEGTEGAQRVAKKIYQSDREKYFYPDQYNNPSNWLAHYKTTANEIWDQTEGNITHFICGLGTTGTFTGTSKRLKELNQEIKCIEMQPDSPLHGLEGLKHLPTADIPGIYDESLRDHLVEVSTEESYKMVKRLAKEEGLFVGISSGAAMAASLKAAEELESGVIVTIFADGGIKYLGENIWE